MILSVRRSEITAWGFASCRPLVVSVRDAIRIGEEISARGASLMVKLVVNQDDSDVTFRIMAIKSAKEEAFSQTACHAAYLATKWWKPSTRNAASLLECVGIPPFMLIPSVCRCRE